MDPNVQRATEFAQEFVKTNPEMGLEVMDLYMLMMDEIDEGGSPSNEADHFISACDDLLKQFK